MPPMSGDPFSLPTHVAVDPRNGDLYVADGYSNARVHKYTPDGRLLFSWASLGPTPGSLTWSTTSPPIWTGGCTWPTERTVVFRFSTPRANTRPNGGTCPGPPACAPDHRGQQLVYVGEYFAGQALNSTGTGLGPRVAIFDTAGNVLARLGDEPAGEEPGRFYAPHGIAVDSRGDLYVAEVSWAEFGKDMEPPKELRSMQKLVRLDGSGGKK